MLENVLVSPTYYDIAWSLTHANEYSKINAMYGSCNYKAVNWETSEEAYTTVQYEQFAKHSSRLLRLIRREQPFHFSRHMKYFHFYVFAESIRFNPCRSCFS